MNHHAATSQAAPWPDDIDLPVVGGSPLAVDVDAMIDDVAARLDTDDRAVAALVGWKSYAFSIAQRAMAAWTRYGVIPDVSVDNTVVSYTDTGLAVGVVHARTVDPSDSLRVALAPLLDDHLPIIGERFREGARVGARSFEAFAVSSLVAAAASAAPTAKRFDAVDELVGCLEPSRHAMVEIAELWTPDGEHLPMALRTACCLIYKCGTGAYCSTCNLIDDTRRTEQLERAGYRWARRPRAVKVTTGP